MWLRRSDRRYYSLTKTLVNGTSIYHGVIGCNTSNCTGGTCVHVSNLAESSCGVGDGVAIKIEPTAKALSQCMSQPSAPTPYHYPNPNKYGNGGDDPEFVGALLGGGIGLAFLVFIIAFAYRR